MDNLIIRGYLKEREDLIMSEEKKTIELKEKDLEKVSGGGDFDYGVSFTQNWRCPNCNETSPAQFRGNDCVATQMKCLTCGHIGATSDFYDTSFIGSGIYLR